MIALQEIFSHVLELITDVLAWVAMPANRLILFGVGMGILFMIVRRVLRMIRG